MAARLLRLRLALLVNGFRRSVWQTVGFAVAALYVLSLVVLVVGAVTALGATDQDLAADVVVVGGAALVLGWWVGPLVAFGLDATLDPLAFATYGIAPRRLVPGLALAALVGVGGGALVLVALGSSLAWVTSPAVLPVALVGGALSVATAVLGSRALTTVLAPVLRGRRAREVTGLIGLLLGVGAWFGFVRLSNGTSISRDSLEPLLAQIVRIVAWTPFGAPWALAGDARAGDWGAFALRALLVAVTLAAAAWVWAWSVGRAMTGVTGGVADAGPGHQGLGWFARLPATPTGAVAARALTYWQRDPRYAASLVVVPLAPVAIVVLAGGDVRTQALLLAAPIVAWLFGFGISNDVAYDSTAFALHAATGVSGRADREGRALAVLVLAAPVVLVLALASVALSGRWELLPVVLGSSVSTLGTALGVASVVSVLYLYPAPKPGDSPFKSPPGSGTSALVGQGIALLAGVVLSVPLIVLVVASVVTGSMLLGWLTLVVGVGGGVAVLLVGIRQGAGVYERQLPELYQQVASYR